MKSLLNINLPGRLFVIFSFIIVPFGETGVMARLTFPDTILVLAIIVLLGYKKIYKPNVSGPLIFLIFILGSAVLSRSQQASIIEVLILFFLILSLLVLYNVYYSNLKQFFLDVSVAVILSLAVGLYDFFAASFGLPRLFPARAPGEILSAFRNAGQAGAYILVMLAILLPVKLSTYRNSFNHKEMRLINWAIIAGVIFLLISGKVAAYAGFFSGVLFLNIMLRNSKAIVATVVLGIFIGIMYLNLEQISPELNKRIQTKIETRVTPNISGNSTMTEHGFIADNIKSSFRAFEDNPLSGSGIGAFFMGYGRHEVHSTYFKMLGEAGILGVIGYAILFGYLLRSILYKPNYVFTKLQNELLDYKKFFLPFFLGCAVSWAYTYHIRKREFWIMLCIILIINAFLKDANKTDLRETLDSPD